MRRFFVLTDAYEELACDMAVRPPSAISEKITASPFAAKLRVAGAAPQWSDLIDPAINEAPCSYDARVTWKNDFVVEWSGERNARALGSPTLTVHADGTATTTALQPSP